MFMLFLLLGFAGLLVMLYVLLRSIEDVARNARKDAKRAETLLVEVDRKLTEILRLQGVEPSTPHKAPPHEAPKMDALDLDFAASAKAEPVNGAFASLPDLKLG